MSIFKKKKIVEDEINFSLSLGVPIVELTLNGKKAKFLIDTGASLNLVSSLKADKYGFKVYSSKDKQEVTGIGGTKNLGSTYDIEVKHGEFKWNIVFFATPLEQVINKLGIVGIIGTKFLKRNGFTIDYRLNKIYKREVVK